MANHSPASTPAVRQVGLSIGISKRLASVWEKCRDRLGEMDIMEKQVADYECKPQPSEYAFQAQFTAIFKELLAQIYPQPGYRVLPEAKV